MKTAGIIAEYNPFHNGHAYHIRETRQRTGADYIVVVMSGDFVQRGEPALLDKYTRAAMALAGGADLVLELPAVCSCASAESFAAGGVRLLQQLGITDLLSFGCESEHLLLIDELAQLYLKETEEFSQYIRSFQRQGMTYPQARAAATMKTLPAKKELRSVTPEELQTLLASPNSILAIEYCKALLKFKSDIKPFAVTRLGSYHSTELPEVPPSSQRSADPADGSFCDVVPEYASATAIRTLLLHQNIHTCQSAADALSRQVPAGVFQELLSRRDYMQADDFSDALGYALLAARNGDLARYADITPDLADRILGQLTEYSSWNSFVDRVKTRQLTRSRVSRALLHLLLQIRPEQTANISESSFPYYARILGFRTKSQPLLTAIKKNSAIPMLTKMADARQVLHQFYQEDREKELLALDLLQTDLFAADLYETTASRRYGRAKKNEYRHGIILADETIS